MKQFLTTFNQIVGPVCVNDEQVSQCRNDTPRAAVEGEADDTVPVHLGPV
jgi:hypothetical protein